MSTRGASSWVRKIATGLPRLDEERLVGRHRLERVEDGAHGLPGACGAAGAAVDHQAARGLSRDLRVEVVQEHPAGGFQLPVGGLDVGPARGAHGAGA